MNRTLLFASALSLVLTAAAQQSREQFSIATLNVDGMPQKILFFNVNADGPGSAGSVRIGQYLSERQYDMVFTQEDFNYHDELTVLLEDDYQIDKALKLGGRQFKVHLWNWSYNGTRSKALEKEIAEGYVDEQGFVYSQDRKRLLKAAPKVKEYWIPEGVEKIDRLAFHHCLFEDLHIPYTCRMDDWPKEEWPVFGNERIQGCIWPWEKPYSEKDGL